MSFKKIIKQTITALLHPIVSICFLKQGCKSFYIGPQMTINSFFDFYVGDSIHIGRNSRFLFVKEYQGVKHNPIIKIGGGTSLGNRFSALAAAPIEIGERCLIASDVLITSENHGCNPELSDNYANIPLITGAVSIGDGCWIGEKVSILPGVALGKRCIVACNSVVTKSFPDYSMIAGIPAKIIKKYDFDTHEWQSYV